MSREAGYTGEREGGGKEENLQSWGRLFFPHKSSGINELQLQFEVAHNRTDLSMMPKTNWLIKSGLGVLCMKEHHGFWVLQ